MENNMAEETQAVQLQIQDLAATIQIIDVATQRGAFRGEELSQIGGVRDRVSAFIKANEPAADEPQPTQEPTTDGA